jgi:GT2 family glycosyltransferase
MTLRCLDMPGSHDKPDEARAAKPVVTLLITAKDRPDELRRTLQELREQRYPALELLVVDDASTISLEPVVRSSWPNAQFFRNDTVRGLVANRSFGIRVARGKYILSLDDDSHLTSPDDLASAVDRMEKEEEVGIMAFLIHHGTECPPVVIRPAERYVHTFVGCGNLIRKQVVDTIGGYRDFYFYYGEEAEYSLRALDEGWRILFFPSVLVHHRVSQTGRVGYRILRYSFRNILWTVVLNMPWSRVLVEGSWKLAVFAWESLRLGEVRAFMHAMASFAGGLGTVIHNRKAISPRTLRVYDALRFREVVDFQRVEEEGGLSWRELRNWFARSRSQRLRAPSVWQTKGHAKGTSVASK